MTVTAASRRPTAAARRFGYFLAVLLNAAMLYLVNVWPGWEVLPFLTSRTSLVIGFVNASIVANLIANVLYLARDPAWLKALGDLVTTAVGLVALVRIWQVFPFDFGTTTFDWALVVRVVLVVAIVGSGIGIVAALVAFFKGLSGRTAAG